MKILFLLPYLDESINSFSKLLVPLVNKLQENNDTVKIISTNKSYQGVFKDIHSSISIIKTPFKVINYILDVVLFTQNAYRYKNKHNFDIIHNLGCGTSLYQNVITAHASHKGWLNLLKIYNEHKIRTILPIHRAILLVEWLNYSVFKNQVIAVSKNIHLQIKQNYTINPNLITTIENGYSRPKYIQNIHIKLPMRIQDSDFKICFVSNNHDKKGLTYILDALLIANSKKLNWSLVILGHDENVQKWKLQVKKFHLDSQVYFAGHKNNIEQYMSICDVLCHPSKYEAFGMIYLEAAMSKLAIIGSEEGILPTLCDSILYGQYIIKHKISSSSVFEALLHLYKNPTIKNHYIKSLHENAQQLTEKKMVEKTLRVYEKVLN